MLVLFRVCGFAENKTRYGELAPEIMQCDMIVIPIPGGSVKKVVCV